MPTFDIDKLSVGGDAQHRLPRRCGAVSRGQHQFTDRNLLHDVHDEETTVLMTSDDLEEEEGQIHVNRIKIVFVCLV